MGQLHHFLGIEVCWHDSGLYLTQQGILLATQKFEFQKLKPYLALIIVGKTMSKADGKVLKGSPIYRNAVGGLQYLIHTRTDITFFLKIN